MKKMILMYLALSIISFLGSGNHFLFNTAISATSGSCPADVSVSDHSDASEEYSIQWCINTYFSKDGGKVTLSSGTYKTSSTIVITSGTIIVGNGEDKTTIKMKGNSHVISNKGDAVSDVKISDVTIKGSGYDTGYSQACIIITDNNGGENSYITIRDSTIEECGQYGIHIKGANGVHLTYNTLLYNGTSRAYDHNIYLRRVKNAKVELSTSNYAAGNGINVSFSKNVVIRNFTAKYNGQNGIRFAASDYVKAYSVTSNTNDENGIELRTEDSSYVNYGCVKDSTFKNNETGYGIYIKTAKKYKLSGNSISGNGSGDKYFSSGSTEASSDICDDIPTDSSAWPFTR